MIVTQNLRLQLPEFYTRQEEKLLLESCRTPAQKFRLLLYADTGARCSEGLLMTLEDFDLRKREVRIPTLKGRFKKKYDDKKLVKRVVPMSDRLFESYLEFYKDLRSKKKSDYLFQSPTEKGKHIHRSAIDKWIKKIASRAGMPKSKRHVHLFRHAFATRLASEGVPIHQIQYLLGHTSIETTSIYTHVRPEDLTKAIETINDEPWYTKLKRKILPSKSAATAMPIVEGGLVDFMVGRKGEMTLLHDCALKKKHVLLTGKPGLGKSILLDNFHAGKVLRMQDLKGGNKKVVGKILMYLYDGDKEEILNALYPEDSYTFSKVVDRTVEKELMKIVREVSEPMEYTLVIDSIDQINKTTSILLERLKVHFHIVAAARKVDVKYLHTFSNFEKIEMEGLDRGEIHTLVEKMTVNYKEIIPDFGNLVDNVYRQTNGNPQYAIELIRTLESEGDFSHRTLSKTYHTAGQKPIDLTMGIVVLISSMAIIRYLGTELGDDKGAFRFIGGAFMIFMLFSRLFFNIGKRKEV